MDPVSVALGVGGLIGTSYSLSKALLEFGDASHEFEVFSQEVNTFASVWSVVQPRLENPTADLTDVCLTNLDKILRDTGTIVRDLQLSVERFKDEYEHTGKVSRHAFLKLSVRSTTKSVQQHKLKKFINRGRVALQRSQLHYATTILNIILATIEYAVQSSQSSRSDLALVMPTPHPHSNHQSSTRTTRASFSMKSFEQGIG